MKNPWQSVPLGTYEKHMEAENVAQLQMLNHIMKKQLNDYITSTVSIWGIAGGNGLEHINEKYVNTIYGIDINHLYLQECRNRFTHFNDKLVLLVLDLTAKTVNPPISELVIANLVIEYIGIENFIRNIEKSKANVVSCVIQQNQNQTFVSESPYNQAFSGIEKIHSDISPNILTEQMQKIKYQLKNKEEFILPNHKFFIRLDYQNTVYNR